MMKSAAGGCSRCEGFTTLAVLGAAFQPPLEPQKSCPPRTYSGVRTSSQPAVIVIYAGNRSGPSPRSAGPPLRVSRRPLAEGTDAPLEGRPRSGRLAVCRRRCGRSAAIIALPIQSTAAQPSRTAARITSRPSGPVSSECALPPQIENPGLLVQRGKNAGRGGAGM